MTEFVFGGQKVEVSVLCLAAIRVASRLLPTIMPKPGDPVSEVSWKIAQTDRTFDVFLQILACQLEDEENPANSLWTYRKLERSIKGAAEMGGVLTGLWELLEESGFVKRGEPMPAGLALDSLQAAPAAETQTG